VRGLFGDPRIGGQYRLDVEASDIRGNASRAHLVLTSANESPDR